MKSVYWNDPDPRVRWGNPNLRWGSPSYLLEPGDEGYVVLQPGQPGYVPPPRPRPRAKRLGRIPSAPTTTTPTHNPTPPMPNNAFHYDIGPVAGGRWRPIATIAGRQTPDQHLAAIVARAATAGVTLTTEQAAAALIASEEETLDQLKVSVAIEYPGGYRRMVPICHNSYPDFNFDGTYDNLEPEAVMYPTRKAKLRVATGFTSTLGVRRDQLGATISRVLCLANNQEDVYKAGKNQQVDGTDLSNMGFYDATTAPDHPEWAGTGVFLTATADGAMTQVPWDSFGPKSPSRISWTMPATLTGPQMLCIKVYKNGGLRTTLFPDPLTPLP